MKRRLAFALLLVGMVLAQPLPDLIVAGSRLENRQLSLAIQNQGPGPGQGKGVAEVSVHIMGTKRVSSYRVEFAAPAKEFEVGWTAPLSLASLDPAHNDLMIQVRLNRDHKLAESRFGNNEYWCQFSKPTPGRKIEPERADLVAQAGLPDLVVKDIFYKNGLAVTYANQGAGATGADFLVKWTANGTYRDGNDYYRFWVPPPGKSNDTGGMSLSLFDLRPGQRVQVTAEVDWENRVRESNEDNNRLTKWVQLGPDSSSLAAPGANAQGNIWVGQEKIPIRCAYALRDKERYITIHLLPFVPQAKDISALVMDELGDVVIHNPSPNKKIWPFPPHAQIELEYLTPGKLYSVSYLTHGLLNRDLYSGRLREHPGLSFTQDSDKSLTFSLKTSFTDRGNTVHLDVRGKAPIFTKASRN